MEKVCSVSFSFTDYPIAKDCQTRPCLGKPNIWILPTLLHKNKYGRSQLCQDQIFSHTIYLYNRKFDWCLIVSAWCDIHTSLTDPLNHDPLNHDPLNHPSITYLTCRLRGIFLQKNISKITFNPFIFGICKQDKKCPRNNARHFIRGSNGYCPHRILAPTAKTWGGTLRHLGHHALFTIKNRGAK